MLFQMNPIIINVTKAKMFCIFNLFSNNNNNRWLSVSFA